MSEPRFLSVEDVIAIHAEMLAAHGGQEGIRDRGLLESAVAMPTQTFDGVYVHDDLFAMASAYAFHVAQNQPFVDGNKRAAIGAALVFLEINDVALREATEELYDAMIGLAERRMSKSGLAALFRTLIEG